MADVLYFFAFFSVLASVLNMTLDLGKKNACSLLATSAICFRKWRVDPHKRRGLFLTLNFITLQALINFLLKRIIKYVLRGTYNSVTMNTHKWLLLTLLSSQIWKPETSSILTVFIHPPPHTLISKSILSVCNHYCQFCTLCSPYFCSCSSTFNVPSGLSLISLWKAPGNWETKKLSGQKDFKLNC